MRFGSTAKVLAECKLKYYRISECQGTEGRPSDAGVHGRGSIVESPCESQLLGAVCLKTVSISTPSEPPAAGMRRLARALRGALGMQASCEADLGRINAKILMESCRHGQVIHMLEQLQVAQT